eukprot:14008909-Heterocapsa_arctica.AAC.1
MAADGLSGNSLDVRGQVVRTFTAGTSASRCCPEPRCGRSHVNDVMELNVGEFIVSTTMLM